MVTVTVTVTVTKVFILRFLLKDRKRITESFTYTGYSVYRGSTMAEKLRGTKIWVLRPGRLPPRARPKADELGVASGRGRTFPL